MNSVFPKQVFPNGAETSAKNAKLKKSGGILCKGNKVEIYQFISANKKAFGLRWLLEKCNVYPNAYYNFLKNRKAKYHSEKQHILAQIEEIYHSHNGIDGYRKMKIYLSRRKIKLSPLTVHKYMNTEF